MTLQKFMRRNSGSLSASTSRLHIAECRLRLVLEAVVEGLDDVFFKVLGARIRARRSLRDQRRRIPRPPSNMNLTSPTVLDQAYRNSQARVLTEFSTGRRQNVG
jgi:hypothetical protein